METVITLDKERAENHASMPGPAEIAGLGAKLAEAREQLSASIGNARLESYSKFCELSTEIVELNKELEKLSAEYEKTKWKLKFSACVLSAAMVLGVYLGFRYGYGEFYRDVQDSVTRKLEGDIRKGVISEERSFYDDLVAGNALDAAGQYAHAIGRLMPCFKEGHSHDAAVLLPLLDAIYKSDDWENAQAVLDVLEKEEPPLGGTRDPTILAYIGAIEVQAPGLQPDWLENGFAILQRAQLLTPPGDAATLNLIHSSYWVYDIQKQDWKSADAEISALKELDVPVSPWDTMKRSRLFVRYFSQSKNLVYEPRIRAMWSELRRKASDPAALPSLAPAGAQ